MDSTSPSVSPPVAEEHATNTTAKEHATDANHTRIINGKRYEFPSTFDQTCPLYRPHGKWAWTEGQPILTMDPGTTLGQGLEGTVDIKVGWIDDKEITYISKLTSVWNYWTQFFSNLYLNASSKYLRPLQGDCVPWIIGVFNCNGGCLGVAQDLPHPTGWREADMYLEEHQKEAIIAAYQKIHDRGVCHGDANYRHWIIGDDGKVTIIDFGLARVADVDEQARRAHVMPCHPVEIQEEMRKVKFMLNWKDSRVREYRLAELRRDREEKDRIAMEAWDSHTMEESMTLPKPVPEPMSEQERAAPVPALRMHHLDDWSYGKTFTARRFEVIRGKGHVTIKKTDIPRPLIPEKVEKEESVPILALPSASPMTKDTPQVPTQRPFEHTSNENSASKKSTKPFPCSDATSQLGDKQTDQAEVQEVQARVSLGKRPREDSSDAGAGANREGLSGERGGKRQKGSEASTLINSDPSPATGRTSASSPSSHGEKRATSPQPAAKPQVDKGFVSDPTPFDLGLNSHTKLMAEARVSWTRFVRANTRAKAIQQQLDEEQYRVERHRSDFLRKFLMLPFANRASIWAELGEPDIRHLLGVTAGKRSTPVKPRATCVLQTARVNLVKSTSGPRGLRDYRRSKAHPRLTAIKCAEARPRPPSKLSRSVDTSTVRASSSTQSNYGSSSSESESDDSGDESRSEPPPVLRAKLAQYKEVVMRRAALQEEQERQWMARTPRKGNLSKGSLVRQDTLPTLASSSGVKQAPVPSSSTKHSASRPTESAPSRAVVRQETLANITIGTTASTPRIGPAPLGAQQVESPSKEFDNSTLVHCEAGVSVATHAGKRKREEIDESVALHEEEPDFKKMKPSLAA